MIYNCVPFKKGNDHVELGYAAPYEEEQAAQCEKNDKKKYCRQV